MIYLYLILVYQCSIPGTVPYMIKDKFERPSDKIIS
jgi:hypothetical protein